MIVVDDEVGCDLATDGAPVGEHLLVFLLGNAMWRHSLEFVSDNIAHMLER